MKTNLLLGIILFLFLGTLSAQERGVTPSNHPTSQPANHPTNTYAVVVGISNYQDPQIPDLKYAHLDAEAFGAFLRSTAGGALDDDHLRVLLNEEATAGNLASALFWLVDECQKGDQAIIYFSGHGDVEAKLRGQPGFLLCWDAPPRVYMAGGTLQLGLLQTVISTLSLDTEAKVTVITDACRSGKLAGSENNGSQLTNANLSQQYAKEIKILSCQPDEYSIEGEQWGGGRGAFSYNLVDALYGMADANSDLAVTLREVGRYLEDHVAAEVAPVSQNPKVVGDPKEHLATVDAKLLADLRSGRTSQMMMLSPIESRGMEDEVLAQVDTTIRELYRLFKKALKDKVFLEPATACADVYYKRLIAEPKMQRLHATMSRNYAAALQDDAQQELNFMLKTGLNKELLFGKSAFNFYKDYPAHLERAAELLGADHYMYAELKARQLFFVGKMKDKKEDKRQAFSQALKWQPNLPHVWLELGKTYNSDSSFLCMNKAMELTPAWITPYLTLASRYQFAEFKKFESLIDKATQIDSNSMAIWYLKAGFYAYNRRNIEKSEMYYLKVIESSKTADFCFPCAHFNLANLYLTANRFSDALREYKAVIELDPNFCYNNNHINDKLTLSYDNSRGYAENLEFYKTILELDSTNAAVNTDLWFLYLENGHTLEAKKQMEKLQRLKKNDTEINYRIGKYYYLRGEESMADVYFNEYLMAKKHWGHLILGWFYTNHGDFEKANKHLLQALTRAPERHGTVYDRAWLHFVFGKRQEAIQMLLTLEEQGVKNIGCMGHRLMFQAFEDGPENAKGYFESFVPDYPNIMTIWECIELMSTNQYDKADAAYLSITESLHDWWIYKFVRIFYVLMKIRQGDYQEAIAIMDKNGMGDYPYPLVTRDVGFASLWDTEAFKTLIKKYYPEKVKN